jgi:hypothetical protein
MGSGSYTLKSGEKSFELALMSCGCSARSTHCPGATSGPRAPGCAAENLALGGVPLALVETLAGMVNVVGYLDAAALASEARRMAGRCWRVVEAQHIVSTLRVVDTIAEQAQLERLLEETKPPVPRDCTHLHYLLSTAVQVWRAISARNRVSVAPVHAGRLLRLAGRRHRGRRDDVRPAALLRGVSRHAVARQSDRNTRRSRSVSTPRRHRPHGGAVRSRA